MTTPLVFPPLPDCTACELHEGCKSPGIPTRLADVPSFGHKRALLFIGEAPGRDEDAAGKSWIGWAGKLLHRLAIETYALHDLADIYLANACRCRPPGNAKPNKSHAKSCRPHLLADIASLATAYGPANLTLVCLGASAVDTLTGGSIRSRLPYQAQAVVPRGSTAPFAFPAFYTYHPAAMAPRRSPELIRPFNTHMQNLHSFLSGSQQTPTTTLPDYLCAPKSIGKPPFVCVDIETYGILRGHEQTVFHPRKSLEVDGIPYASQVICASLAYGHPDDIHTAWYNLQSGSQRRAFHHALSRLPDTTTIVGMNTTYDILYLRSCFSELAVLFRPARFRLDDLAIVNHQHDDTRPEHSLKALSHLFGTANYHRLSVSTLPTGQQASSPDDPNLAWYNCTDTLSTLRLYYRFLGELHETWPPETPGISRARFRSDILWTVLHMAEHGIAFSRPALSRAHDRLQIKAERTLALAKRRGYTLCSAAKSPAFGGPGSVDSVRQLVSAALSSAGLLNDPRVEITDKQRAIATGRNNIQLLLRTLPRMNPHYIDVKALDLYRRTSKIRDSYTHLLLNVPARGLLRNGIAYPSWYPVPTHVKDEGGDEGGTRQGRFAAHDPAAQTFPPVIDRCLTSRYCGGILRAYDFKQAELVMAALLSGDPAMLDIFRRGEDPHHTTALLLWPALQIGAPDYAKKRNLAKRANFLILYRGGAHKLVETVRRYMGHELPLPDASDIIDTLWQHRETLREWQDSLIETVIHHGYLLLPTGYRRTFVRDRDTVLSTYVNEICNCPVQLLTAQVLQSCQAEIVRQRDLRHLPFVMPTQSHDSLITDSAPEAAAEVDALVRATLNAPPLWLALCAWKGRDVPLAHEAKLLFPRRPTPGAV